MRNVQSHTCAIPCTHNDSQCNDINDDNNLMIVTRKLLFIYLFINNNNIFYTSHLLHFLLFYIRLVLSYSHDCTLPPQFFFLLLLSWDTIEYSSVNIVQESIRKKFCMINCTNYLEYHLKETWNLPRINKVVQRRTNPHNFFLHLFVEWMT